MRRGAELNAENFERLLSWLSPDRDAAGKKYEEIRQRLLKIFTCRGCVEPEALADETLTRGASRVVEISITYVGDPAIFFYGIARKVFLEYTRRKPDSPRAPPVPQDPPLDDERQQECLEQCLQKLSPADQALILSYYPDEKGERIKHREKLALDRGTGVNALRIRVCRIRKYLYECVVQCLEQVAPGEMDSLRVH